MIGRKKGSRVSNGGEGKRRLRITRRGFIRISILGALGLVGGKGFLNSRSLELVEMKVNLKRLPIDLTISGHTHGGQVVLPFMGALYIPSPFGQKYRYGLVRDGERQTYISRGLGLFFVPIRINCPPDVTVLTLRR